MTARVNLWSEQFGFKRTLDTLLLLYSRLYYYYYSRLHYCSTLDFTTNGTHDTTTLLFTREASLPFPTFAPMNGKFLPLDLPTWPHPSSPPRLIVSDASAQSCEPRKRGVI